MKSPERLLCWLIYGGVDRGDGDRAGAHGAVLRQPEAACAGVFEGDAGVGGVVAEVAAALSEGRAVGDSYPGQSPGLTWVFLP